MHTAAVLTTALTATAAIVGWWHTRRALIRERAASRITAAAQAREHQARLDTARAAMQRRLNREAVLREADLVLDRALDQYTQHDQHESGDTDG